MAMFCEDDVTPFMIPYWRKSVKDLLALIEGEDWDILQLSNVEARDYDEKTGNRKRWIRRGPLEFVPASVDEISSRLGGYLLKEKYWWGAAVSPMVHHLLPPPPLLLSHRALALS